MHLFEWFFRPWMHHRLGGIYITGLPRALPVDEGVLLAANHVSWWDGFLLREVQRRSGNKGPLVTMMDAHELRRFPFFRFLGVAGLRPTVAATRDALRQVAAMRARGPLWLSFFPQGRIWPSWKRPLGFRGGVVRFAETLAPAIVLPVGLHVEPLTKEKPTAFAAVGQPLHITGGTPLDVGVLEAHVETAVTFIHRHLAKYGEAALQHWPGMYEPLPAHSSDPFTPVVGQVL